jgi:Carboxypeptidase regulatory-like domain
MRWSWKGTAALALAALLASVPAAWSQPAGGNIYGSVTDESGAVLPGATVTLSGELGTRTTTSGGQGDFRFVGVDHGTYTLKVALTGFTTVTRDVVVTLGGNVNLVFTLKVAQMEESVTVSAETPVVDLKRTGTATTISKAELEGIPSSRDPWALMRTIPGVLVDRVNVAGSESGQQSNFFGKGADPKDAVWSLDGVIITDMAAVGASPTYFTYDAFDEVNFSTGGNDVRVSTGGIGVGLVTKRGTNAFHGGAGGYFASNDLQSSNLPDELRGDPRLAGNDKADHTDQITDVSFDLGGPIVRDKLWFYGSYGRNDIRVRRLNQSFDKTLLSSYTAKVNWQAGANDMVSAFWFLGSKSKVGRTGAAGAVEHLEGTLWDQGGQYPSNPHGLTKLEWNHVFSPSFVMTAKAAYYSTGFNLFPQGGLDGVFILDNVNSVARGTSDARLFERPQYTGTLDGSYFFSGAGGGHELKFGLSWRKVDSLSERVWPGDKVQLRLNPTSTRARFLRDQAAGVQNHYYTAYLGDTLTAGRVTVNAGLRFDRQTGKNKATSVEANPLLPELLPALDYPGGTESIVWTDVSPRLGVTFALDEARRTVLRASFARYAGQLSNGDSGWDNPLGLSFVEYDWNDDGDGRFDIGEVDFSRVRQTNVDLDNPGGFGESPNRIDPDYHSNKDNEIVVGLERELLPNLAMSAAYTWRKSTDFTATQLLSGYYWYSWIGVTRADYVQGDPVTQNGFTATPWVLTDEAAARATGGALLRNRPDYSRTFNGVELALVKRLSSKWMARAAFSFNDWRENVGPGAILNPTRHDLDTLTDGGPVIPFSAGSGKNYYANARWQVNVNALYQLPAGFEIAGNLFGRQGYPKPVYLQLDTGALDGTLNVLAVNEADDIRLPNLWNLDLRLAKNLRVGATSLVLGAEVFNALNSNTELYRNPSASSNNFNRLDEILAPRIVRLGARLTF